MSDPVEVLRAIQLRQADDGDADLLALLLEDQTSRVVTSPDKTTVIGYVDAGGGKHSLEIA